MVINFLTTSFSGSVDTRTGGVIYDENFYRILKEVHPDVNFYGDDFFVSQYENSAGGGGHWAGNCDYLVTNSRLYTRMGLVNFRRLKQKYPRTKFIAIHHHSNYMDHTGAMRLIHRQLELKLLRSTSSLIVPNQYVIDQLASDFGITNTVYLPSSFEKRHYEVSELNSKRLLFVGTIERRKGVLYGLRAFKIIHDCLPEYKYHIAGSIRPSNGKYYSSLLKYVGENHLEDSVIFEGRVSQERLDWLYSHSDLFLFPSLLEGYGWVIAEAMARGLPVAAFDNSAMPYSVKDNVNGLLIENKNSALMGRRVCELLKDKGRMKMLQQGALETFAGTPDIDSLNRQTRDYIESWE